MPDLELPKAYKKRLIDKINNELNTATRREGRGDHKKFYQNLMTERQIYIIRNEFFIVNAKLFKNYKKYIFYE